MNVRRVTRSPRTHRALARCALALGGLLLGSTASAAACSANQCSGQVQSVYVSTAGSVYVSLVGGLTGVSICAPAAGVYAELLASTTNSKLIFAMLLSAQYAGRPVTLRFLDSPPSGSGCVIQYAVSA